jgi:hypothetical protein
MLPQEPNSTETYIFNPDLRDFSFSLSDDDNIVHEYTLLAQEITTLPKYIADHGANKLADYILGKRGIKQNYELDKNNLMKEIYVNLS